MFLHVTRVRHLEGYRLELGFNDGSIRQVDLSKELHGDVFEPLRDVEFFKKAEVNRKTNTIEWPNGADFSPEFLHKIGTMTEHVA